MALDKEAEFLNVLVLASLFYNTLKSFGNIHSSLKEMKDEKVYLAQLGIEQARLLIWGEQMGIFSLPSSLSFLDAGSDQETARKARDARLDQEEHRTNLEHLMNSIIHSLSQPNESDVDTTGLRPWQQGVAHFLEQPAADQTRMERFEQSYSYLLELAQDKASVKRPSRLATQQWVIYDTVRFSNFVKSTKRQVDTLLMALNINDKVEDILLGDVRDLGRHSGGSPGKSSVKDMAKLKLLIRACKGRYPALLNEAQKTLGHVQKDTTQEQDMAARVHKIMEPVQPDSAVGSGTTTPTEKRPGFMRRLSSQAWGRLPGRKTPGSSRAASPEGSGRKTPGRRTPGSSKPVTPAASRPTSPVPE